MAPNPTHYEPRRRLLKTEADVIAAFGGTTVLAGLLGKSLSGVSNWRTIGIPHKIFPELVALARKHRVRGVSLETLYRIREERDGRVAANSTQQVAAAAQ